MLGTACVQTAGQLAHEPLFIEIENPRQQARGPDAAEATVQIEEPCARAGSRRADSSRNTGRSRTANDHVGIVMYRQGLGRFTEKAFLNPPGRGCGFTSREVRQTRSRDRSCHRRLEKSTPVHRTG